MDREIVIDIVKNCIGIEKDSLDKIIFYCDRIVIYSFSGVIFYKIVIILDSLDDKYIIVNCCSNIVYCYIYNFNCYF